LDPLTIRHYALLNVAEFALWSGLPLILLFAVRAIRALGARGPAPPPCR